LLRFDLKFELFYNLLLLEFASKYGIGQTLWRITREDASSGLLLD
jgi:hypothetical protein